MNEYGMKLFHETRVKNIKLLFLYLKCRETGKSCVNQVVD